MPNISIIIPVYNTPLDLLRRCLESVTGQTLRDIEIICVNDGSINNSPEILREYAARDARVRLVDLGENKGVSIARNIGMAAARGEYLGFVDSDDYVDKAFFELLYNTALKSKADIIKGDMVWIAYDGSFLKKNINTSIKINRMNFQWQLWTAIYSSKLIIENDVKFPENISNHEECVFVIKAAYHAKKIEINDNALYYYCKRAESADSEKLSMDKIISHLNARDIIFEFINRVPIGRDEYDLIFESQVHSAINLLTRNNEHDSVYKIATWLLKAFDFCKFPINAHHCSFEYIYDSMIHNRLDGLRNNLFPNNKITTSNRIAELRHRVKKAMHN